MSSNTRIKWTIVMCAAAALWCASKGCQQPPRDVVGEVAMGALPEFVEPQPQPQQEQQQPVQPAAATTTNPPTDNLAVSLINPSRSTFKFNGRPETLTTEITTKQAISFTISEDQPGFPGPPNWGDKNAKVGTFANFTVVFGPDPSVSGAEAKGALHQSNPYFYLESGWAYFAGSGAMGETTRVRTSPDSTEYVIQIYYNGSVVIHRVINVSADPNHKVRIICPRADTGAVIGELERCYYVEFPADTPPCPTSITPLPISGSPNVQKFLDAIGVTVVCP